MHARQGLDALREICSYWPRGPLDADFREPLRSDVPGGFRIEAARVIDPKTQKSAGTAKLRAPTRWDETGGTYAAWNERVDSKAELKISYKLGELDLARAVELVGPEFNTYGGPFVLELDVSIDGHRQTIRSPEFTREPPHIMPACQTNAEIASITPAYRIAHGSEAARSLTPASRAPRVGPGAGRTGVGSRRASRRPSPLRRRAWP